MKNYILVRSKQALKEVFQVASAIVLSVGGAGAIIIAATSFLSSRIANRLEEKYQLKLNMELEKCKANLEQRIYISRVQFDTEIEIYRELTKGIFEFLVVLNTSVNDKDYPKVEQLDSSEKLGKKELFLLKWSIRLPLYKPFFTRMPHLYQNRYMMNVKS